MEWPLDSLLLISSISGGSRGPLESLKDILPLVRTRTCVRNPCERVGRVQPKRMPKCVNQLKENKPQVGVVARASTWEAAVGGLL